ncbi:MAG: multifunctional oxoglutarate decarboxylase/oxoglutarate dehydrogenase thiamine pyrophosphate-binding subunit/dihydrolipoyllysine-residue succinyltransferase subunit [Gemmatimonadetes bacterium]|nr:multifunctional oxoglutarate decarboxylase/oxoglutarate dehydrogenase thiamine pyrophosphate-binding subunit/dihydrolipoyllysine-residue succinyltransferase subunit [Gemmatimonadota bacterium]
MFENIFETVNSGFAQALYEDFLRDPESISAEWRELFESGLAGEAPPGDEQPEETAGSGVPETGTPSPPTSPAAPGTTPITGPALRLLQNMEASLDIPTATSFREIDVTILWNTRRSLNAQLAARGIKLSFTHIIGWAIVRACERFASMYSAVVEEGGEPHRLSPDAVNFGLAVDVQRRDGTRKLMVPVIKAADAMGFADYHREYERVIAGARDGKLLPDAYTGSTITLTNPGTIGTVASVPRLMKGQGSIIAMGAIRDVPTRRLMTITSTYDHRIIQGAESGLFLQLIDAYLRGEHGFYREIAEEMGIDGAVTLVEAAAPAGAAPPEVQGDMLYHVAAAMSLVKAHRTHGYLAARLDPLGTEPIGDPALHPEPLNLTPDIMRQIPAAALRTYVGGETLEDILPRLRETYCGTIAYEIEHIANHEERVWLRRVIESGEHRAPLTDEEKRKLLSQLTRVDVLERFLQKNYLGHKRFGIEGLDMLVPMLHQTLDLACHDGVRQVVMGMAHRGRLNVLTHILGRPYETLLAEFEGGRAVEETLTPRGGTGDVKYHHGATGTYTTIHGEEIALTLMANPSHLEAVNPAVEGNTRAKQTDRSGRDAKHDPTIVLPILMHGDAAFAAQGVVAETFNLSRLAGYGTGGTLHIITNNQIGFTTDISEARSTDFASDLAKGYDVPIVHVNADDPEACLAAIRLALMYRKKFHADFVIDLVGYRRHGHNEGDEPRYTQPRMYALVASHPPVRELYAQRLMELGVVNAAEVTAEADRVYQELTETQARLRRDLERLGEGEEPDRVSGTFRVVQEPATAVDAGALRTLNDELHRVPAGFNLSRKLMKQFKLRASALDGDATIDWAHAETLALASLRLDGVPVRFTGQDTERGTFSQRHLVLHDAESGERYTPIQHITEAKAPFELHNSPLSEYGALGFEYGYAAAVPEALVLWEAQFGDFVNGAEIIIDQFLIAGLSKWGQTSRLTLLLPHGHEGQGPEHSSGRIERFLALTAEGNLRVANCSTPAQYFHLLRRQGLHGEVRPLVIFTPKSLLRHPRAMSAFHELTDGAFSPVLDDPTLPGEHGAVTRLVLCSGKVFYDVVTAQRRAEARHVAMGRIELLYPFPREEITALVGRYPALTEIVWLQEEPQNMGPRKWTVPQIRELAPEGTTVRWISRPERSSPAEGYPAAHKAEQERLVRAALA